MPLEPMSSGMSEGENPYRVGPPKFLREGNITRIDRLTDGRVMCCLCCEYKFPGELEPVAGERGKLWDYCRACAAIERAIASTDQRP